MISNQDDTDFEQKICANIAAHGCHINFIFDPEGDDLAFAYSVGFTKTVDQPEVIVFGLPMDIMKYMINETLTQCRAGLRLNDGVRISGLLAGFDVAVRDVPPQRIEREFFNSAMWFHQKEFGDELTSAVQLVWPGSETGLFPWDKGCSEQVIAHQPALYEAKLDS
jgi:Domain of unknown function (DUF4262)